MRLTPRIRGKHKRWHVWFAWYPVWCHSVKRGGWGMYWLSSLERCWQGDWYRGGWHYRDK